MLFDANSTALVAVQIEAVGVTAEVDGVENERGLVEAKKVKLKAAAN